MIHHTDTCIACNNDSCHKQRGRVRNDFYETPHWQIEALLERVKPSGTIFEPCCGDGAISNFLSDYCVENIEVLTNDIELTRKADTHFDARDIHGWNNFCIGYRNKIRNKINWTITNPPFTAAFEILVNAYAHSNYVALLLRLSFLEPTREREKFLSTIPPKRVIILPRWKYNPDSKGTDSVTTAWMVWGEDIAPGVEVVGLDEKGKV
jgi:hypothetical protein